MADQLFPDVPLIPTQVATSWTVGGRCAHCDQRLAYGKPVYKLAPACCEPHRKPYESGSVNGPGRWVCNTCLHKLI